MVGDLFTPEHQASPPWFAVTSDRKGMLTLGTAPHLEFFIIVGVVAAAFGTGRSQFFSCLFIDTFPITVRPTRSHPTLSLNIEINSLLR